MKETLRVVSENGVWVTEEKEIKEGDGVELEFQSNPEDGDSIVINSKEDYTSSMAVIETVEDAEKLIEYLNKFINRNRMNE